jgi:hypothetical protein
VTKLGLAPEVQYIYDLELSPDTSLVPNDDEVGQFYLWDMNEVNVTNTIIYSFIYLFIYYPDY